MIRFQSGGSSLGAVVGLVVVLGAAACSEGAEPGPVEPPPPPPPPELEGTWNPRASLPEPVQEFHGAVLGGRIYVAGGIREGNATSDRAYRYDPSADRWERIADLPSPRHHMPLVVAGDSLYAIGGFGPEGFAPQSNLWLYLEDTDEWVDRWSLGIPRGASAAAELEGRIYLFGGYTHDNQLVSAVEVYDPGVDRWTRVAPLPTPVDHLAAASLGGKVFAFGGRTIFLGAITTAVQRYDPEEDRWDEPAPLPLATAGHAAVVLGDRIHILGGEAPGAAFDLHHAYAPDEDEWSTALAPLPTARHGLAAAVVNGRLFAIGGGPFAGFSQTDVVEVFDPE